MSEHWEDEAHTTNSVEVLRAEFRKRLYFAEAEEEEDPYAGAQAGPYRKEVLAPSFCYSDYCARRGCGLTAVERLELSFSTMTKTLGFCSKHAAEESKA